MKASTCSWSEFQETRGAYFYDYIPVFLGSDCEFNFEECDRPCLHGGLCVDGGNNPYHGYTGSGFIETYCKTVMTLCWSKIFHNDTTC